IELLSDRGKSLIVSLSNKNLNIGKSVGDGISTSITLDEVVARLDSISPDTLVLLGGVLCSFLSLLSVLLGSGSSSGGSLSSLLLLLSLAGSLLSSLLRLGLTGILLGILAVALFLLELPDSRIEVKTVVDQLS